MGYRFAVTGIGLCVGNIASHEDLIEAILTEKQPAKPKASPTAHRALEEALQYRDAQPVLLLTDAPVSQGELQALDISRQENLADFSAMLSEAGRLFEEKKWENILLLAHSPEGCAAALLSKQPRSAFAQAELTHSAGAVPAMDGLMELITAVVEIRFAFRLHGQKKGVWHWAEKRVRTLDSLGLRLEEAAQVHAPVLASRQYLLPVCFGTVAEAEQALGRLLQDARQHGLHQTMTAAIARWKTAPKGQNTAVFLAEDDESLASQVRSLLENRSRLEAAGFTWRSATGSCYVRKTTQTPKVVFMNPPGGMFHSKPFNRFVSKLYGFVREPFRPHRRLFYNASENPLLRHYLEEINTTYAVMYLLETIGIRADQLSGASMGEIVFMLSNCTVPGESEQAWNRAKHIMENTMRQVLEGRREQEQAYFGHPVELKKYYLKCNAQQAKAALAHYPQVFAIIEGSPEDLLICGEASACRELIRELGCVSVEMDDPTYVHTPVLDGQFDTICRDVQESGMRLDVQTMPYRLLSTHLCAELDGSNQMFARNFASIITKTVDYTQAVRQLYRQDGRVFIDLSTTQLCSGWAKTTLSGCPDAQVLSIYEDKPTDAYLLELCAVLMAWGVDFDFDKLYGRLTFAKDTPNTLPAQYMSMNLRAYQLYLQAREKQFAQLLHRAKPYLWDRAQVIEMTENAMSSVLGQQYRQVDSYPVRARMPLPPYLFVSRIVSIDAEFGKLRPSSIVAEYDLDESCVFRMGDSQISPLIGSEASHIGIFLLAYMGVDAMFRGKRIYRAIGSEQRTLSERPFRVGDTLRTVLRIDRFVENGDTLLVFFTFETYNGGALISVTETTGGFFTKEQLSSNKGVIQPRTSAEPITPRAFPHDTQFRESAYTPAQVSAFFAGDYEACFGAMERPRLRERYYLPHDMKMIDRVTRIDYTGGAFGRGIICGEKQLTADMWPFKAHFKNDPVFPAIIMTEGITQLGAFLFARAGLMSRYPNAIFTAVADNSVRSKFRGQARHGSSTLRYEVSVRQVQEQENGISVLLDAKIFNNNLQIIQVEGFGLKLLGEGGSHA